jgi:histidine triad (HIT) family protein
MDCIFCKIVNGELPSYKVYEDDDILAFLDISPINYGHTLVIPKKHFQNLESIDENLLCKIIIIVKKVGQILKNGLGVEGYNVCENNDAVAGQIVSHLHFHVVPRSEGDGLGIWPQGKYGENEAEEILKKIKL